MRRWLELGTLVAGLAVLGACTSGSVSEAVGLGKNVPDEFAVTKRAPLTLPPDYDLRPPRADAGAPDADNTTEQARQILTGGGADGGGSWGEPGAGAGAGAEPGAGTGTGAETAAGAGTGPVIGATAGGSASSEGQQALLQEAEGEPGEGDLVQSAGAPRQAGDDAEGALLQKLVAAPASDAAGDGQKPGAPVVVERNEDELDDLEETVN